MRLAHRLRRFAAGTHALTLLAAPALAAQARPATQRPAQAAPAAKATLVTSVEGITEYALPNGMRVLLFPDQSKPTVTVNVTYMTGSAQEGYGETGMAHLLEHLVFKGSKGHPEMTQEFAKYGARRNGSTWYDRTNYFETVPASDENLDWALDLEADRMINSFIAKKDLETEFSVVRNELESGENNPFRVLIDRTFRAAYKWHGYGRTTIGSRSDVEGVPIERLQAFYRKYYQPDNAMLVVAGKFDPARTLAVIERKFGSIPKPVRTLERGNLLFAGYTVEPTQDGEQVVYVRRVGDQQVLMQGYHIPAGTHPDAAAIQVLASVLSTSPTGRLYKAVVDPKLAASASANMFQFRDPSMLLLAAQVQMTQSLDSARAAIEKAMEEARTGAFTAEEVDRAKASFARNFDLALNNSDGIGINLSEWASMGDWRMMFLHRDRVAAVTPADVKRVAGAYLKPQNRTTAMFIPTASPDRAEIPATPSVAVALAGYKGKAVVQAGEAFDASPKNIETRVKRTTLANGASVQLLPKQTRGASVNAQIMLRHGTEQTLTGKAQISSLTAGMLSRGTTQLSRQQVQDSMAKLKASAFIGGGGNNTTVNVVTTRPNLVAALDLVAQQLKSPRFDPEELDKLKKERLAGLEAAKSQPDFQAQIAINKRMIVKPKGHPLYTSDADEQIADINAVTQADLKAFHTAFYGASFADISVVGDFDQAEVTAALTKHFGDWKNPQPFARLVRTYVKTDSTLQNIETPDKANSFFIAAQNIEIKDDDADYPALVFGNYMLGGAGMASRITGRLRQKEGISYGANSFLQVQSQDQYGQWGALAILAPQNVERLTQAFREEIDRALKEGFSQKEIDEMRNGYLLARSQGRANDNELVGLLVTRRFVGRTLAYDEDFEKKISGLTADQVNAALRKHIVPKNIIIVRAGDFAKNPPVKATP